MPELSLLNCRLDKRYDIHSKLGSGSYAEIFVARDIIAPAGSPHKLVVLKALNVFLQEDTDPDLERTLVENFQNEAVALDRVRHPNIISRLGHGTARDLDGTMFHYLVLEYLAGGDLQKASRQSKLSLSTAMKYIEQICAGLKHAHERGIIHRDIKPQNLLLSADRETVKIADFGVARFFQNDAPVTRVGTNIYAPPEHSPMLAGDGGLFASSPLTPAADIYSLAKSVYTMVTGETPRFYANQPITDLPPSVRDRNWAPELKRVLYKATLNDASLRHQSVVDLWADLLDVRRIADSGESSVSMEPSLGAVPHARISKGYTALPPKRAAFDTSHDLHLRHPFIPRERVSAAPIQAIPTVNSEREANHPQAAENAPKLKIAHEAGTAKPKGRLWKRLVTFSILLSLFTVVLYGTSSYLRGRGILPQIVNPFGAQTGRTNTDVNLRPSPNANNDPIGLVTKNSRVRILKTQNNWYQVDVLEQGRDEPLPESRGWLNGRYIDID